MTRLTAIHISRWKPFFSFIMAASLLDHRAGTVLCKDIDLFPLDAQLDNSLLEASANMGRTGFKRFATVVMPLCMPSILAAALMVFMRALADFGTPIANTTMITSAPPQIRMVFQMAFPMVANTWT